MIKWIEIWYGELMRLADSENVFHMILITDLYRYQYELKKYPTKIIFRLKICLDTSLSADLILSI